MNKNENEWRDKEVRLFPSISIKSEREAARRILRKHQDPELKDLDEYGKDLIRKGLLHPEVEKYNLRGELFPYP